MQKVRNNPMFSTHNPSAKILSVGVANGAWLSASERIPVPIVTVNQLGVNWRTISDACRTAGTEAGEFGVKMLDMAVFPMSDGSSLVASRMRATRPTVQP